MATEVKIPNVGESITSANVARWHKQTGEPVTQGEIVLTIETDKVSNDLEATVSGRLNILVSEGEEVSIGTVVALIEEDGAAQESADPSDKKPEGDKPSTSPSTESCGCPEVKVDVIVPHAGESITSASIGLWHVADGDLVSEGEALVTLETDKVSNELEANVDGVIHLMATVGQEVVIGAVIAQITMGTSELHISRPISETSRHVVAPVEKSPTPPHPKAKTQPKISASSTPSVTPQPFAPSERIKPDFSLTPNPSQRAGQPMSEDNGRTTRTKMSMLRRKIASHLVGAQQTAAILTTFNEVDMSAIMQIRKDVQEGFVAKHGCKLGFMSFFVKAVVQALKDVPSVNGKIDGNDIIQNHFYDIGVAIGTQKGLVVPVLRDCEQKGFAKIEQDILNYATKAQDGKMELSDLQGGVFTISNGGVYGSLLSTPILNPPQSGILGMHTIQQRPVAVDGEVVIRPMMYLAMSYDHRLVDGKEAVTFLIRIKDCLENPSRLMLEM